MEKILVLIQNLLSGLQVLLMQKEILIFLLKAERIIPIIMLSLLSK